MNRDQLEAVSRQNAKTIYLGNNTALCKILGDRHIYVDTMDFSVASWLMLEGFWESWITAEMIRLLRPGMRCIDVGANLGYFSILMAREVGRSGHVIAVEPNPRLTNLLRMSARLNGAGSYLQIVEKAASSTDDKAVQLRVPANELGGASLVLPHQAVSDEIHEVSTVTLDRLVAGERVDFVKIDAEGSEEAIWDGMTGVLEDNPGVIVTLEFNPSLLPKPERFLKKLRSSGFRIQSLEPHGVIQIHGDEPLHRELSMLLLTR